MLRTVTNPRGCLLVAFALDVSGILWRPPTPGILSDAGLGIVTRFGCVGPARLAGPTATYGWNHALTPAPCWPTGLGATLSGAEPQLRPYLGLSPSCALPHPAHDLVIHPAAPGHLPVAPVAPFGV